MGGSGAAGTGRRPGCGIGCLIPPGQARLRHQPHDVVGAGLNQAGLFAKQIEGLPERDLTRVEAYLAVLELVLRVHQDNRVTTLLAKSVTASATGVLWYTRCRPCWEQGTRGSRRVSRSCPPGPRPGAAPPNPCSWSLAAALPGQGRRWRPAARWLSRDPRRHRCPAERSVSGSSRGLTGSAAGAGTPINIPRPMARISSRPLYDFILSFPPTVIDRSPVWIGLFPPSIQHKSIPSRWCCEQQLILAQQAFSQPSGTEQETRQRGKRFAGRWGKEKRPWSKAPGTSQRLRWEREKLTPATC